jgi:hypothetical protein
VRVLRPQRWEQKARNYTPVLGIEDGNVVLLPILRN